MIKKNSEEFEQGGQTLKSEPPTASAGYAHGVDTLDSCAQCGADPAKYCTAGRHKGREPHNLDGAWMKCGLCGNTITVIGHQAVKRARLAWNLRA
jgi:hypothetical protein